MMPKVIATTRATQEMLRKHQKQLERFPRGDPEFSIPQPPRLGIPYYVAIIFQAMRIKGVTYDELSEKSGVPGQTIREWKRGGRARGRDRASSPDSARLFRVYQALGIRYRCWI